jgi:hypothetical protein
MAFQTTRALLYRMFRGSTQLSELASDWRAPVHTALTCIEQEVRHGSVMYFACADSYVQEPKFTQAEIKCVYRDYQSQAFSTRSC